MSAPYPMLDVSRTPPIPFHRVVQVELRKAFDTVASFWLVISIAVLVVLIAGFVLILGLGTSNEVDFTYVTTPTAFVLQPALAILAIMLVTSEWGQRTAMVTFALEARRPRVIYAKLASALVLGAALMVIVMVLSLLCMAILELFSPDDTFWNLGFLRFVGLIASATVPILVGYALATLILNTPAAIVAFPVVLYVVPLALGFIGVFWKAFKGFAAYLDIFAADKRLIFANMDTGKDWAHLVVVAIVWLLVPLVLGQTRIMRAEVK